VAGRLAKHNGLAIDTLYPPPRLIDSLHPGEHGDYVFTVGRLNPIKRFDLLIRAMKHTRTPVRAVIAGSGPEREPLLDLARRLGVEGKVELLDWVADERMTELYAGCLAVFYAPFDEDYGYVTLQAFLAGKPVITAKDSGGVLEWVDDGVTGIVTDGSAAAIGAAIDRLAGDRELARRMGDAGRERVAELAWGPVVDRLLGVSA